MVATSGRGWRLAPCLGLLFKEADARKPSRSHAADGTIGNAEHAARTSDHNPADGWVCAGDIDDDNDSEELGVDLLIAHLVATRDDRVKQIIGNRTTWKAYDSRGVPAWTPQPYTGPNAHDHHRHISVWNTPEARNDLSPWWPTVKPAPHQEDVMLRIATIKGEPTAPGDQKDIAAKYRVLSATDKSGNVFDVEAWHLDGAEYDLWRYIGLDEDPKVGDAKIWHGTKIPVHGGPFAQTGG